MPNSFRCEVEETYDYDFLGCYIDMGLMQPINFFTQQEFSFSPPKESLMQSRYPVGSCWDFTSTSQSSARTRLPSATSLKNSALLAANLTSTASTIILHMKNGEEILAIVNRNMFIGFHKGVQRIWKQLFRGNAHVSSLIVDTQRTQFLKTAGRLKILKYAGTVGSYLGVAASGYDLTRDPLNERKGFNVATDLLFLVVPVAAAAGAIAVSPYLLLGLAITSTVAAVSDAVTGRNHMDDIYSFLVDQTPELLFNAVQTIFKN